MKDWLIGTYKSEDGKRFEEQDSEHLFVIIAMNIL